MKKKPFDPTLPGYLGKLTKEELDAESDQFDVEFSAFDQFREPTAKELATHPKPHRGRPPTDACERPVRVLVTMPPKLLKRADAHARKTGMTRAGLIQFALQSVLKRRRSA